MNLFQCGQSQETSDYRSTVGVIRSRGDNVARQLLAFGFEIHIVKSDVLHNGRLR